MNGNIKISNKISLKYVPRIPVDRKYKDYVYRKMLIQEYLKK